MCTFSEPLRKVERVLKYLNMKLELRLKILPVLQCGVWRRKRKNRRAQTHKHVPVVLFMSVPVLSQSPVTDTLVCNAA